MKLHGIFNNTHKTLAQTGIREREMVSADMAPAIAGTNSERESASGSKMDANGGKEGEKGK